MGSRKRGPSEPARTPRPRTVLEVKAPPEESTGERIVTRKVGELRPRPRPPIIDDPVHPATARIWRFPLERATDLARSAAQALPAEGTPERTNGRILVDSDGGSLGLAPATESREMLAALAGGGGRLAGRLIAVEEGGERRPWAELRLVA